MGPIALFKMNFPYENYVDPLTQLYTPKVQYLNEKTPLPVRVRNYLKVANWAYEGKCEKVEGIRSLSFEELPELFTKYYNETIYKQNGYAILAPTPFHMWFGMEGDDTVLIGFAGTSNLPSVMTDIQHFFGYQTSFCQMAIGVVYLMLEHYPSHNVRVIGHSLGGGLAQYSVAANIKRAQGRLTGIGFNSAGLSPEICLSLGTSLLLAKFSISHYITPCDRVNKLGILAGSHIRLPQKGSSGHRTVDIAPCVDEYIRMERQMEELDLLVLSSIIKDPGVGFPFTSVHIPCVIKDLFSIFPPRLWALSCVPEDNSKLEMWERYKYIVYQNAFGVDKWSAGSLG